MTDYGDALNHYRRELAKAYGLPEERVILRVFQNIEDVDAIGAGNLHIQYPDPYDWMDENLREAAGRLTMVQLYAEYGEYGKDVACDPGLTKEVLDQACQIVAFIAEHWDEVYSWVMGYQDALDEIDDGELDATEWDRGGMDWPDGDD